MSRGEPLHDRAAPPSRLLRWVGVAALLGIGLWMRMAPAGALLTVVPVSWQSTTPVNLFFARGSLLFPVSRRFHPGDELPRVVLEALFAGPRASRTVRSAIPNDVTIRSLSVVDGVASIDLSRDPAHGDRARMALVAITETMTTVPGIRSVAISVQGTPLQVPVPRTALLYFPASAGLVAVPTSATDPRTALTAYLSGPPAREMTGVPPDVRLQKYELSPSDHQLSLTFSYTSALRDLALEHPDRTRMLLLGLIATLTQFRDVRTVRLDFGGQSRLGLGECSDLLRSPQPRPALLNDERLLD